MNKLEEDFKKFRDICIVIRRNYNTYNALYFSGNDDLLIKVACSFFNDISEILQRDWILLVCKIMDKAEKKIGNRKRENLSINLINKQLKQRNLITKGIDNLSQQLLGYGTLIMPARNRRIAHFDRESQFDNNVLGQTTVEELEQFLENLQKYCDAVGNAIGVGPLDFTCTSGSGDVYDLLKVMKKNLNFT